MALGIKGFNNKSTGNLGENNEPSYESYAIHDNCAKAKNYHKNIKSINKAKLNKSKRRIK